MNSRVRLQVLSGKQQSIYMYCISVLPLLPLSKNRFLDGVEMSLGIFVPHVDMWYGVFVDFSEAKFEEQPLVRGGNR